MWCPVMGPFFLVNLHATIATIQVTDEYCILYMLHPTSKLMFSFTWVAQYYIAYKKQGNLIIVQRLLQLLNKVLVILSQWQV